MEFPAELEIIDSTAMRILDQFEFDLTDDELGFCTLKTDDHWIVFGLGSTPSTESMGYLAVEKCSIEPIRINLAEVLAGKLRDLQVDCLNFSIGNDEIQISASSVFPGNRATPRETITILNLREMELDGLEYSTGLSMSPKSAAKLVIVLSSLTL